METLAIFAILWSLPWKGVALWKASRNYQKGWFIVLLIVQTLGLLEIIYLGAFQRDRNAKVELPTRMRRSD